mmetsp:Transcript_26533/g.61941  ORF Transcript_26533/g.61941 Transcript_26533/m.61941 type:complete len:1205 (+) Transcript_26533:50-3664(+)
MQTSAVAQSSHAPIEANSDGAAVGPSPVDQAALARPYLGRRLAEGEAWCLVSQKWWDTWSAYVHLDDKAGLSKPEELDVSEPPRFVRSISGPKSGSAPPPIDNSYILERNDPSEASVPVLQRGLLEQQDFTLVPQELWKLLHLWYGGGPEIRRNVIKISPTELQVELHPLRVTLFKADATGEVAANAATTVVASRRSTVRDLLKQCLTDLGVTCKADDARLWICEDGSSDPAVLADVQGWQVVQPATETLEDIGIQDGAKAIVEVCARTSLMNLSRSESKEGWPLFARHRKEYKAKAVKDPRKPDCALVTGDRIDASAMEGISQYSRAWYPATVIQDDDPERVLVQFQHRKAPPRKMPELAKDKPSSGAGYFMSEKRTVELTDEAKDALGKVYDYYASLAENKSHMDKKAIAAMISCATNTVCQQDDFRVSSMVRDYDEDADGLLSLEDFLKYWAARVASQSYNLNFELERLFGRAKVDYGSEEDKLLRAGKEWIERTSERLAPFKSHNAQYPYIRKEDREFSDFQREDWVDFRLGKEWRSARISMVDWDDWTVLVAPSATTSSSSSKIPSSLGSRLLDDYDAKEWVPMESERLAPHQTKSLEDAVEVHLPEVAAPGAGVCEMPGAAGLTNLGNTCFMNSTLQALSNSPLLRQYYRSGRYKADICKCPLSMDGRLAAGFAEVLGLLWSDTQKVISPTRLKALVGEKRPDFQGYQQHDAQEFLTFLLDGLHEDGNRVPYPRPIVEDPEVEGKTDRDVASEAWAKYLTRNNSRIVELFQFQLRSEVTFPDTAKQYKSLTFDPIMYLSLPVPKPPHSVPVTVLPLGYPNVPPLKLVIEIGFDKCFKDLEAELVTELRKHEDTAESANENGKRSPRCFLFADMFDNRPARFFDSDHGIKDIRATDKIWALEVELLRQVPEEKQKFAAVLVRTRPEKNAWSSLRQFAPPRAIAFEPGVTTNTQVRSELMEYAESLHRVLVPESPGLAAGAVTVTTIAYSHYSREDGDHLPEGGVFKLEQQDSLCLNFLNGKFTSDALPAAVDASANGKGSADVTLERCLDNFSSCEELSQDDWVYCRQTKNFEKSLKKLDIWSVPEFLIVHLKRFGRERLTGPLEKIDTLVRFPMELDLSTRVQGPLDDRGAHYSLYAVVNHSGGMGHGHYTAYAKVGEGDDRTWFHFNDSFVTAAQESNIVSKAAYILFYERCAARSD